MAVCQLRGLNPQPLNGGLSITTMALSCPTMQRLSSNSYGTHVSWDQLLPDWPPLTPLGAVWMEVFVVRPRRGEEVRPSEGCRAPSIRGEHLGTRSSILAPESPFLNFLKQPIFLSVKLIRKYNSCKCCCEALNVHWQDYWHLISSKYQNRDGVISCCMCCVSIYSVIPLWCIWFQRCESLLRVWNTCSLHASGGRSLSHVKEVIKERNSSMVLVVASNIVFFLIL